MSLASLVAVVAVGLAILWRRPNAHEDTAPGNRPSAREPQTSSQPEGASQVHTVNPVDLPVLGSQGEDGTEGSPCDRLAPAEYRSIPNGSRIMPDIGTNGYPTSDDGVKANSRRLEFLLLHNS